MSAMISAIVLAAGESTRMGAENKLLLPFQGTTLLGATVTAVMQSRVGETIVVVGHEQERVRKVLAGLPVRIVFNPDYRDGMSTSIHAGVRACSPGTRGLMICLSDLPRVGSEELNRLIDRFEGAGRDAIVVPTFSGQRGNPVLFSVRFQPEVLAVRGPVGGCKSVVKAHPEAVIEVPLERDGVLQDIDTPEDYRRLLGANP
jgi:molybdenum cofactor cytidylyltransferase